MKRTLTQTIIIYSLLCLSLNVAAISGQERTSEGVNAKNLTTQQTIERSIRGSETHAYQIKLAANQYVRVEVEQKEIDVMVWLFDPSGRLVLRMDSDPRYLWRESLSAIAEIGGTYRLKVTGKGGTENAGSYTAKIAELRKSAVSDRKRIRAEQTLIEAIQIEQRQNPTEAARIYRTALNSWQELGDTFWTAVTMLLISRASKNRNLEADALTNLGIYYHNTAFYTKYKKERDDYFQRAIIYFKNAYSIYETRGFADSLKGKIICSRYIGSCYSGLTEIEKAITYFQSSLRLLSEWGQYCSTCDLTIARVFLYGDIGIAYFSEGNEEEALRYLKQVDYGNLEYWKDNKEILKRSLDILNALLISLGDVAEYEYSIKTYEQIVKNSEFYGYKNENLMGFYSSLGKAYTEAGYYDLAKLSYDKSLGISLNIQRSLINSKAAEDSLLREDAITIESTVRNNIGIDYLRNGNFDEAQQCIQQALDIATRQKDSLSIIKWKANLAGVYARQKKYDLAIKSFDEVIPQLKKLLVEYAAKFTSTKDIDVRLQEKNLAAFVGIDLYYYGVILRETGKLQEAINYHQESIRTLNQYKFRKFEARARVELGLDYLAQDNPELAVEEFKSAYVLSTAAQARDEQAASLDGLMQAWESLRNAGLAIVYGKQSVNLLQKTRTELERLGKSVASEFVKDNENIYRRLANLLISEGRLPEAQIILDLLKEEEYKTTTRSGETPASVPYTQVEADVIARVEDLVTLERERNELERVQKETGSLSGPQQTRREELDSKIEAANKAVKDTLAALNNSLRNSRAQINIDELKNDGELQGALTYLRSKTESGVVALYTVLGTEEAIDAKNSNKKMKTAFGWVVMITPDDYKAYPIDANKLEQLVPTFRYQLVHGEPNPQPLAEEIYTAIFRQTSDKQRRTLEQDLQDYLKPYADKTIMWSLDGILRYIPMAALHDGKQYLVEKYSTNLFTKNSFISLVEENKDAWRVLGVGVSTQRENLKELASARIELETIIREPNKQSGILNGKIELDDNFQKQRFFDEVSSGEFTVAHIASHYIFNPTRLDESFLLTGDGHLTFAELRGKKNLFSALDLLTLSACNTGVSGNSNNGKEAEGFSYLAQALGAKSVIASLWEVSDVDASEFMIQFYKLRADHPQMTKGEAFRQAQLSLLRANSNPHYWASFVLMGNWRK